MNRLLPFVCRFVDASFRRSLPTYAVAACLCLAGAAAMGDDQDEMLPENPAWAANHPRIVLNKETLAHVRTAIKEEGTPPALAWQRVEKDCDAILNGTAAKKNLDLEHPFADLEGLTIGTHKEQGSLEGHIRSWTVPCDVFAFRYAISGDVRSGQAAAKIALAIARKLPPDSPVLGKGFFYTRTFLVRSMVFTYDWCYPVLTPGERMELRRALGEHARKMYSQSINDLWGQTTMGRIWNWNPGIASAWGLAMLAIMDETNLPDQQWLFQAARNVEDYFRIGVDQKGAGIEGPAYFSYGSGSSFYFMESLRQWSGEDLFYDTHMDRFVKWLPYEMLPDGKRVNNLCDSGYKVAYSDGITYSLTRMPDQKLAQWAWQNLWGGNGVTWNNVDDLSVILWWQKAPAPAQPDLPLADFAPGRGVMVARSGWDKDSVYFSLLAQVYSAIKHDQADKGQYTLYGYGEDFAIDSGYANDGNLNPNKSYSTQAHNLILIDGVGQAAAKYHAQTSGFFKGFIHSDAADWAWADLKPPYEYYLDTPKKGGADGIAYRKVWQNHILQANRQVLFIRGKLPYAILFDDIQKDDKERTYSWLLHTAKGKTFDVKGSTVTVAADVRAMALNKVAVQPRPTKEEPSTGAGTWKKEITVPAEGSYTVWCYSGTEYPDPFQSDSFFFSIDGGKAGFAKGERPHDFVWAMRAAPGLGWVQLNDDNSRTEVPALALKAGRHVLEFKVRETGAGIGAVCLMPEGQKPGLDAAAKGGVLVAASEGTLTAPMKLVEQSGGREKGILQATLLSPSQFEASQDDFETSNDGVHPRLELKTKAVAPNYLVVLMPRPADAKDPRPAPLAKAVAMKRGVAGTVAADPAGEDLVARWDGKGIMNNDLATNAQLFWMRGAPTKACAVVRGDALNWKGKPLFQSNAEASFVFDGKTLQVSGKDVSVVRHAFGPGVKLVVNGNEVQANAENGMAEWKK